MAALYSTLFEVSVLPILSKAALYGASLVPLFLTGALRGEALRLTLFLAMDDALTFSRTETLDIHAVL